MITLEMIAAAIPGAPAENVAHYAGAVIAACDEFDIEHGVEMAAFLSQIAVESQNLTRVTENLNYTITGLLRVFGKYFTPELAAEYARQPERIANRAYGDRSDLGNGDEASGDGWRFRGRGLIQITGRNNYLACGKALGVDLLESPEYLQTAEGAARSAAWFWDANDVGRFAKIGDFDGVCDMINRGHKTKAVGDAIGYHERVLAYQAACRALGV